MKKLFTLITVCVITNAYAQENPIPNWNFNDWIDYGDYEDPTSWGSNNYLTAGFGVKPVESDTISVEGLAAKMVTKAGDNFSVPGVLCSNGYFDINAEGCIGGFACDYPFIFFNGFYKCNPAGTDTSGAGAVLWQWNSTTQKRDTIAWAIAKFYESNFDYIFFSIPFDYVTPGIPDSAMIMLTSSTALGQDPPAGTKLRIDNLAFSDLATGVAELSEMEVKVYPNPAVNYVTVTLPRTPDKLSIVVFDYLGRMVDLKEMPTHEYVLATHNLRSGFYFFQILDENQVPVKSGSFEVQN